MIERIGKSSWGPRLVEAVAAGEKLGIAQEQAHLEQARAAKEAEMVAWGPVAVKWVDQYLYPLITKVVAAGECRHVFEPIWEGPFHVLSSVIDEEDGIFSTTELSSPTQTEANGWANPRPVITIGWDTDF